MTAMDDFEAHREQVYRWAHRILGSHEDASDAVQDVCIRWLVQAGRTVPENPRAWLRRATIHRAIDLVRARRRHASGAEPVIRVPDACEIGELRADLDDALGILSRAQRAVVTAKELENRTFSEIALEMGIAVSTVKTHYLRALRSLKGRLGGKYGFERS